MYQDLINQAPQLSSEFIAAIAASSPWALQKAGESAVGEVVKDGWSWLKSVFSKKGKDQELDNLVERPKDPKIQGRLELILEDYLKENPEEMDYTH